MLSSGFQKSACVRLRRVFEMSFPARLVHVGNQEKKLTCAGQSNYNNSILISVMTGAILSQYDASISVQGGAILAAHRIFVGFGRRGQRICPSAKLMRGEKVSFAQRRGAPAVGDAIQLLAPRLFIGACSAPKPARLSAGRARGEIE
jgi:hypothetical protein